MFAKNRRQVQTMEDRICLKNVRFLNRCMQPSGLAILTKLDTLRW